MKLSAAGNVEFLYIGDRALLFSESHQCLFELSPPAAYIWCRITEGADTREIVPELVARGIPPEAAEQQIERTLHQWEQEGLIDVPSPVHPDPNIVTMTISLPNVSVDLTVPAGAGHDLLLQAFGHLVGAHRPPDVVIRLHGAEGGMALHGPARAVSFHAGDEIVPVVKALLTEIVLSRTGREIALHAACLVRRGHANLLLGQPGAGKTSLTIALAETGFDYGSDDIALIGTDGRARGVPFAPAAKSGIWPLLKSARPDLAATPIHRRSDHKRVRYLTPLRPCTSEAHAASTLLFLRRRLSESPRLVPVDAVTTLKELIRNGYTASGRLSGAGARGLAHLVSGARAFEFHYSDLGHAVEFLRAFDDESTQASERTCGMSARLAAS
jgi:hypothetical protein